MRKVIAISLLLLASTAQAQVPDVSKMIPNPPIPMEVYNQWQRDKAPQSDDIDRLRRELEKTRREMDSLKSELNYLRTGR